MADLSEETLNTIFFLQRRLLGIVNEATKFAFIIFESFGETEETIPELTELQNIQERATAYYVKLHRLSLQVSEAQLTATSAMLDLLAQAIVQTQAVADAGEASNQEIRRNWNLL
jgi:tetrahydrodipicolinate N-succinyltransferase